MASKKKATKKKTSRKKAAPAEQAPLAPQPVGDRGDLAVFQRCDEIVSESGLVYSGAQGRSMVEMIGVSAAIQELRSLLTDEILERYVVPLKNTATGFLTDERDGGRRYTLTELRECIIDARMMGLSLGGNEMNIISGRTMAVQNGLFRLVNEFPGLSHLELHYEDIDELTASSAWVNVSASWLLNGEKQELAARVHCNAKVGAKTPPADAVIGKAKRKLLAKILERITGQPVSEGSVDDAIDVSGQVVNEGDAPEVKGDDREGLGSSFRGEKKTTKKRTKVVSPEPERKDEAASPPPAGNGSSEMMTADDWKDLGAVIEEWWPSKTAIERRELLGEVVRSDILPQLGEADREYTRKTTPREWKGHIHRAIKARKQAETAEA